MAAVAAVTFWPTPVDRGLAEPLTSVLAALHDAGMPAWIGYGSVEAAGNIALFVPFGLLIAAILPRVLTWLATPIGFLSSAAIESVQALFLAQRYPTVDDVLANTLGAAVGTLIVYAFRGRYRHARRH